MGDLKIIRMDLAGKYFFEWPIVKNAFTEESGSQPFRIRSLTFWWIKRTYRTGIDGEVLVKHRVAV